MTGITDYQEIVKVTTTNEVTQITTEEVQVIVKSYDVVQVYNEGNSGAVVKTWVAGENISSGRLLEVRSGKVYYHDPNGTKEPYGIAGNAALEDDTVIVTLSGDITITGWGLTAEAVYYSRDNGAIATSPNGTGRSQMIGVSVSTNTLNVNIQQPIIY